MAMQKNRNLFQLSLIWMFIFVCLQCLVVKCRPSGTTKTLPVKSAINPTVDSQFEKDNGTLDVSNENINVPSIDNKTSNGNINKTTNKMKGTTNTTVSPRSQTTTTTAPASPKNLTGSAGQKLPQKSATAEKHGEPTVEKEEDELTTKKVKDKNDENTPTTAKKTGESKDKNEVTTSTTNNKTGESKDKNDVTTPTTTKKTGESKDKNDVTPPTTTKKTGESIKNKNDENTPTTTKKNGESKDNNDVTTPKTNKKTDESKDNNDVTKPKTTQKTDESKDNNDVTTPTTNKKTGDTKDEIVLNEPPTTKTSDAQQEQNVVKESPNENGQTDIQGNKISLDAGKTNDRKNDENKKPVNSGTLYEDKEDTGGHFMAYFITFVVICIAGYIIYHNKQKILAFILEGKKDGSRRRPNSKEYKRLKTDEVMPSLEKNTSDNKYIY